MEKYHVWNRSGSLLARITCRRWVLSHRFWSIVTGAEMPLNCQIEGGLLISHPDGIVIHPGARIGPNCLVFQQVTIGTNNPRVGVPQLGGHVDVGAGAKILGPVLIGNDVRVGANSVVLSDVPKDAVAAGVSASVVRSPYTQS